MTKITKYQAENGEEFFTEKEAVDYENSIVDKNGVKIRVGDWLKESWYFHGFRGGSNFPFDAEEYKDADKSFRFIQYDHSLRLGIGRVNRQGWPVSNYEVEIVTEEEKNTLENDPKYIYTKDIPYSYKPYYYRIRREHEKENAK